MVPVLWTSPEGCTGCAACRQICPQQAIALKPDKSGFLLAHIDPEKCVECGLCAKICPMKSHRPAAATNPMAFAMKHRSEAVRRQSASGGAFTAILEAFAPDAVFGAAYCEDFQVRHICAVTPEEIARLRGSKYVQSDVGDTYKQAKELLQAGKRVLFTGTPCQIAGLNAYLRKSHPNLLTCDLICEGVQSQAFFDRYRQHMEEKYGKLSSVSFREKEKNGWERSDFQMRFENGKKYTRTCHTKDSAYMNSMLFQGGNRDSCYACPFAAVPRQGDFTIGDLWGWREMVPEWNDNIGISLVVCNTEKAAQYLPRLKELAEMKEVTVEQAAKHNPNLLRPTPQLPTRGSYLADVERMPFAELEKKWLKPRSLLRKTASKLLFRLKK